MTQFRSFGMLLPQSEAEATMGTHRVQEDKALWSFYLWTRPATSKLFVKKVLPALGFTVHWTADYMGNTNGCDSYVSMRKEDWPIMEVYEILST